LLGQGLGFRNFVRRRFLKMELAILILASFSAPLYLEAATIRVPADQVTIQAAINAAAVNDDIFVSPGTYFENINLLGKRLFISSLNGPEVTIIDGGQHDSVVSYVSGERGVLAGFTIRNGRSGFDTPGFGRGGGIRIANGAQPLIFGNIITGNRACEGVGISVTSSSATILQNVITGNSQFGCSGGVGGGGISVVGDQGDFLFTYIVENTISNNFLGSANGGGISLFSAGDAVVRSNIIERNTVTGLSPCAQGGGIWIVNVSGALIVQNVITGNTAGCGGGVYWAIPSGSPGPQLVNNTIVDNDSPTGAGVFASFFNNQVALINNIIVESDAQTAVYCTNLAGSNPPTFRFNNIFAPQGVAYGGVCTDQTGANGNISADPLFVDSANGDYHLQLGSPSIDAGDNTVPGLPPTDLERRNRIKDGNRDGVAVVDMGAFEAALPFPAFLRGSGPDANPAVLFLDGAAPTSSTAKFRDSTALKVSAGNPWTLIGSWSAEPISLSGTLSALSDLHVWLGLKNKDDTGRRFDLAVEVWKNGALVAQGELFCITDVTTDPALAKEVAVPFEPFSSVSFDGTNDVLSLKVFTRIGTDGTGSLCGRFRNATGLRLYFDATDRNSHFGGDID
jgi:Right handed beta helix region